MVCVFENRIGSKNIVAKYLKEAGGGKFPPLQKPVKNFDQFNRFIVSLKVFIKQRFYIFFTTTSLSPSSPPPPTNQPPQKYYKTQRKPAQFRESQISS